MLGLNTNFLLLGLSAWPSFWCKWKERKGLWEAVVSFMPVPNSRFGWIGAGYVW